MNSHRAKGRDKKWTKQINIRSDKREEIEVKIKFNSINKYNF